MRFVEVLHRLLVLIGVAIAGWAVSLPLNAAVEASLTMHPEEGATSLLAEAPRPSLEARRTHVLFGLPFERERVTRPSGAPPFAGQLLGTLQAKAPAHGAAALLLPGGRTVTVWEGDHVLDAEVLSVEHDSIWLRRGERSERLALRGRAAPSPPQPVSQLGPTDFTVSRQAVLAQLSNLYDLSNSMRIVPAFRDGSQIGFRFIATKPDAELLTLGLKSGDVIRSLNGTSLDSLERVLGFANTLLASPSIDLELERAGQPLTHHYRLD